MDLFCQMKDTHHIRAVQNRISSLIRQKVIENQQIFPDEMDFDGKKRTRILAILEELAQQKRFSGLEQSVRRVCELIEEGREFDMTL